MAQILVSVAVGAAVSFGLGFLSQALQKNKTITQEGSRLSESQVSSSAEGSIIRRMWGRARVGGQVIWATKFKETEATVITGGGSGGKWGPSQPTVKTTNYSYSVSFAIALCEGSDRCRIGRIWADGQIMKLDKVVLRFYKGTQTQMPDPLIEAKEGSGHAPAYRGIAYLVFENLELENYGNRIPQINVEVLKPVSDSNPEILENALKAVAIIPGTGEVALATTTHAIQINLYTYDHLNRSTSATRTDFNVSLDNLQEAAPNVNSAGLVVSWFGNDLRVGSCQLRPKKEDVRTQTNAPYDWKVSGITRPAAQAVSTDPTTLRPAYGGTPSDLSVREAITGLKSRGFRVVMYPFILMDIPATNTLPNPYTGINGQPAHPWRGRITCTPAPGQPGTVDKTAAAQTQINTFMGAAANAHFGAWDGLSIPYSGPVEFSYRRMILHYAHLVKDLLGPNDAFLIGSEMVGLTSVRSSASNYPFVNALITLAANVRAVLNPAVKISYAADWSEFHSHRPTDGSNDVYFNLDPLWSSPNVDFVGIDAYFPGADWRDGTDHLDHVSGPGGATSTYGAYLESQVEGGEYYDYFYANQSDRDNQVRTPITDTAHAEHWVFRQKDIRGWWQNSHRNRPGGVRSATPTSWVAGSKPIWFTEFGCPAVDKGANQPNVFPDPKSSESALPHYSTGLRDDFIQRRYNETLLKYWGQNGGAMLSPDNMFAWAWDARPFPQFPSDNNKWADANNWRIGHWLTGRLGLVPITTLVREICSFVNFDLNNVDTDELLGANALVRGYLVEELHSPREMLETLSKIYLFDGWESEGKLKFSLRLNAGITPVNKDSFISGSENPGGYVLTRAQETELPYAVKMSFFDEESDYQVGAADARKGVGGALSVNTLALPLVLPQEYVRSLGDILIQEAWAQREGAVFSLPRSFVKFDPGDILALTLKNRQFLFRIQGVDFGDKINLEMISHDPTIYGGIEASGRLAKSSENPFFDISGVEFLDIPLLTGEEPTPWAPRLVAFQDPWPGQVNVFKDNYAGGFVLDQSISTPTLMGELVAELFSGPVDKWDLGNSVFVDLYDRNGILTSTTELAVFAGANSLAVYNAAIGEWEIVQFVNAELISSEPRYRLSQLLRGRLGTEGARANPIPLGARVVFFNNLTLPQLNMSLSERLTSRTYRYGPAEVAVSDPVYTQVTRSFKGIGLRPYSPVSLKARRNVATGDITLTWIRRTRFGGDNWEPEDVPLNEEVERYVVEIFNSIGGIVRVATVNGPPVLLYTAAQQTVDFGSPIAAGANFRFKVCQVSVIYGRGEPRERITVV